MRSPTIAALLLLAIAAPAQAQQEPGVTYDNGPATKEYAIPLATARSEAAGGSGSTHRAQTTAPLFGVGVGPRRTTGSSPHRSRLKVRRARRTRHAAVGGGPASGGAPPFRAANAGTPSGGAGAAVTIGGVGGSILLLGAVLGLAARRRRARA